MKITDSIWSVGVLNPNMRIFDVVMSTDYGTSYNSYIIKGSQKTALIETCHHRYFDHFIYNISKVVNPEQIDYIILNHCEPDHSGSLERLIKLCPNAQILASKAGTIYLKNITNKQDLPMSAIKDGQEIDLGGKTLKFIIAPFLHWPDSMFTYCEQEKALFPCDFLGAHYCEPYILDKYITYEDKYKKALAEYFGAIFAPFRSYVAAGLDKIKNLDIEYAFVSHGPILTKERLLGYALGEYEKWSLPQPECKEVPVFYCSAYHNTEKIAEAIAEGIRLALPEKTSNIYDINEYEMPYLQNLLNTCSMFAIGSPTINSDAVAPVWELLSHVDAISSKKKRALVFGSYGWSGEAVPNLIARLQGLKIKVYGEGFKVLFVPSEEDLQKAVELGTEFALVE